MKKTTISLVAIALVLPVLVGAQTATVTPKRVDREDWKKPMVELRDRIRVERQNLKASTTMMKGKENKEERKDLRQEVKGKINQLRSQRVGIFAENLLQRIGQQISNLTNLLTRTNDRAKEMATAGKDTTAITAKITAAQASLDAAKAEFTLLPAKFDPLLTSTDTKLIAEAKSSASSTIAKIRETHARIVEAINLIKSAN
ncbi:MAG: hypothetical protein WCW56_00170 [Candidatus Paceibacterota bacterium]|jgi:hypothetical protein